MTEMVERARAMAIRAHGEQKYGDEPYVKHLDEVANLVRAWGSKAEIVAYLHDTIEDTRLTLEEIRAEFGDDVALAVSIVTDAPGANRRERKQATNDKLSDAYAGSICGSLALVVKAADRLANVRACVAGGNSGLLEMYRQEHRSFEAAAYRFNLNSVFFEELARLLA